MILRVRFSDLFRCTLDRATGNEGYIGLSPKGDEYHVVVPVDAQIARGIKAGNRPLDGTPFGGYARWLYFRCEPFSSDEAPESQAETHRNIRREASRANGNRLVEWAAGIGIRIEVQDD